MNNNKIIFLKEYVLYIHYVVDAGPCQVRERNRFPTLTELTFPWERQTMNSKYNLNSKLCGVLEDDLEKKTKEELSKGDYEYRDGAEETLNGVVWDRHYCDL